MSDEGFGGLTHFFNDMYDNFREDVFEQRCAARAREICKQYKPKVKTEFADLIKHPQKNTLKRWVHFFKVVDVKEFGHPNGAGLWNKKYQLSHLIEDSHWTGGGNHTHNDYHRFKINEEPMVEAFEKAVLEEIDKGITNAFK